MEKPGRFGRFRVSKTSAHDHHGDYQAYRHRPATAGAGPTSTSGYTSGSGIGSIAGPGPGSGSGPGAGAGVAVTTTPSTSTSAATAPPGLSSASAPSAASASSPADGDQLHCRKTEADLACTRCRRIRKKCDRALPECTRCKAAEADCVFPIDGRTANPAASSEFAGLTARVAWLSDIVDGLLPRGTESISSFETNTAAVERLLRQVAPSTSAAQTATATATAGSVAAAAAATSPANHNPPPTPIYGRPPHGSVPSSASVSYHSPASQHLGPSGSRGVYLPAVRTFPGGIGRHDLIDAYFSHIHRSYPFLDRHEVISEADAIAHLFDHDHVEIRFDTVRLYLVMALGCESLCRTQKLDAHAMTCFSVPYPEIVGMCIVGHSVASLQILLLLCLVAIFDPAGWPPWTLTGFLVRQAVSLGLNRKVGSESGLKLLQAEFRHRLFWGIYSMDRLVSVSYGLPCTLANEDNNVPLPGVTMEEFAASEQADYITTLQVTRQAIELRRVEGRIMSRLHHAENPADGLNVGQVMSEREWHCSVEGLRREGEDWYTGGCLLARAEPHEKPIHNTISWLNFNYHWLLVLLSFPSRPAVQIVGSANHPEARRAAIKYVQSVYGQLQERHLALNHTLLNKMMAVLRLFLETSTRCDDMDGVERGAVKTALVQCLEILVNYAPHWTLATQCHALFRRLHYYVSQQEYGTPSMASNYQQPQQQQQDQQHHHHSFARNHQASFQSMGGSPVAALTPTPDSSSSRPSPYFDSGGGLLRHDPLRQGVPNDVLDDLDRDIRSFLRSGLGDASVYAS